MTLDPGAQRVLEMVANSGLPKYEDVDPATARTLYSKGRAVMQPDPQEVAETRDLSAPGPAGPIPLRLYRPIGSSPEDVLPVLIYYHGGGFVIGDIETHDGVCRHLANASKCAVISVHYRLAPEHKFPAAVEDAFATAQWVADQERSLNLDTSRIAVGGDSAGGNLSTVVCLLARDAGQPKIAFQMLLYPGTDLSMSLPSQQRLAEGYLLTKYNQRWFLDHYTRSEEDKADWRASPLRAPSLKGLPPAYIMTAGYDPVSDDGIVYGERLQKEGVQVAMRHFENQIHGFLTMGRIIPDSAVALDEAGAALRKALGRA